MGARSKQDPALAGAAVAGAILSTLATVLQLALLLAAIHMPTLHALTVPLIFSSVSIAFYGLVLTIISLRETSPIEEKQDRAISIKTALIFASVIAVVLLVSAALKDWFGQAGLVIASAVAGIADAHAPTISVASMAAAGKLSPEAATLPILIGFSVNAMSKAVMSIISGNPRYSRLVIPGLILQVSAIWAGWWFF